MEAKGFKDTKLCIFYLGGRHYCRHPVVKGSEFCDEHDGLRCVVCGKQAEIFCHEDIFRKCSHCKVVVVDQECLVPLCQSSDCANLHYLRGHSTGKQGELRQEFWEGIGSEYREQH